MTRFGLLYLQEIVHPHLLETPLCRPLPIWRTILLYHPYPSFLRHEGFSVSLLCHIQQPPNSFTLFSRFCVTKLRRKQHSKSKEDFRKTSRGTKKRKQNFAILYFHLLLRLHFRGGSNCPLSQPKLDARPWLLRPPI